MIVVQQHQPTHGSSSSQFSNQALTIKNAIDFFTKREFKDLVPDFSKTVHFSSFLLDRKKTTLYPSIDLHIFKDESMLFVRKKLGPDGKYSEIRSLDPLNTDEVEEFMYESVDNETMKMVHGLITFMSKVFMGKYIIDEYTNPSDVVLDPEDSTKVVWELYNRYRGFLTGGTFDG